jgi:hypothetical protein
MKPFDPMTISAKVSAKDWVQLRALFVFQRAPREYAKLERMRIARWGFQTGQCVTIPKTLGESARIYYALCDRLGPATVCRMAKLIAAEYA